MTRRPWFWPLVGVAVYVAGVNDELLHHVSEAWLDLGKGVQIVIVLVVLALALWAVSGVLRRRNEAYHAAAHAADPERS